jgi:hypothetical protein
MLAKKKEKGAIICCVKPEDIKKRQKQSSPTGNRTLAAWVKTMNPNH